MRTYHLRGIRLRDIDLSPDVFAVVMATGIVAVAANYRPYPQIGRVLAGIALVAFVLLGGGLVLRIAVGPRTAIRQVNDPDVALRLFTSVAACAVLGTRFAADTWAVWLFAAAGLAAWLVLVPLAVRDVCSRPRAQLRDHAHGAWLLPSVATSGLASLAAGLATDIGSPALLLTGIGFWLLALATYLAVTWLIAWRAVAAPFVPETVTPDSWILMGALAITGLTGSHLLAAARALDPDIAGWVRTATLILWAIASAWIPVLLYAEMWRVDQRAGSLHYAAAWWSAVFPIGMYSTDTAAAALSLGIVKLNTIALVFLWIAITLWLLVAIGLTHRGLLTLRRSSDAANRHGIQTGGRIT